MFSKTSLLLGLVAGAAAQSSSGTPTGCAAIAALQEQAFAANSSLKPTDVRFPPSVAFDCLTSVPINKTAAAAYINWYLPYFEFQSTTAWLKDPPPSYQQPAVDMKGGFANILSKIGNNSYNNEYEFESDVANLIHQAHEGHLGVQLPAFGFFGVIAPWDFVSVSSDGVALPKVYTLEDLLLASSGGVVPSSVAQINGQSVLDYMTEYAKTASSGVIEPHADWNAVFANSARQFAGFPNIFTGGYPYFPGADTLNITFANGTSVTGNWQSLGGNLTGVTSGEDFYNKIVAPPASYQAPASEGVPTSNNLTTLPAVGLPGFPLSPIVVQEGLGDGGFVSGYFINKSSIAVLSIPSFLMQDKLGETAQAAFTEFLAKSKEAGMKKLVIDLQGNGGGSVLLGLDLFKQLFPSIEPFAGSNMRAHTALDIIGNTLAQANATVAQQLVGVPMYYNTMVDVNETDFTDWGDFFGPVEEHGDFFTNTERFNLSNAYFTVRSAGIQISGYGSETVPPAYFAPEDILLLTDGFCGSTCSVFSEQMKSNAGVKSVVVGGRPETGPMQAVAGTRGSLIYDVASISQIINETIQSNTSIHVDQVPSVVPPPFNLGDPSKYSFNFRNQVRKDAQQVPLQFTYEAADCRIFYTAAMLADYRVLWQAAADALWTNTSLCVSGSTSQASAGNFTDIVGGPNSTVPISSSVVPSGTAIPSGPSSTHSSASPSQTGNSASTMGAGMGVFLVSAFSLVFSVLL